MVCGSTAAARLPLPLHQFTRSSTTGLKAASFPPAFLAPKIHAQPFSVQSQSLASASPSKSTTPNSAQNLRGALRRIGQASKWSSQPPSKPPSSNHAKPTTARTLARRSSSSQGGQRSPASRQNNNQGFRLRAKALLDHLTNVSQGIDARVRSRRTSAAQIDADITLALTHFETEMKALRVMIKSKDVLVDPVNAWKSASRIKAPYNSAIRFCMHHGRTERAFRLLNQMKKDGIFPSAPTFTILINGLTKALLSQEQSASADQERQPLLQYKEFQRTQEVYQDLEKLWKQAYPRYFQRHGAPKPTDHLALDKANFHTLTEQARRNLVSQQASVHEAREFPQVLSNALGSYIHFLRSVNLRDEMDKLFDQLFPPTVIETMAKGLASDASPQDKLELANRKISNLLPLGDMTTFSAVLKGVRNSDSDCVVRIERIWTRLSKLIDLERHERLSAPQTTANQRYKPKALPHKGPDHALEAGTEVLRFVPDEQLMTQFFIRLHESADKDRLGLSILSHVYGLDLENTADGMLRDPDFPSDKLDPVDLQRYLRTDVHAIDGLGHPVSELRGPTVATAALVMLSEPKTWKQYVALFNYLWARAHAEHQDTRLQANTMDSMLSESAVFGAEIRPTTAMRLLWLLSEVGDPVGARVLLEAIKRAAQGASNTRFGEQDAIISQARRAQRASSQSRRSAAFDWKPSDVCYVRAMHANMKAMSDGPDGLTAAVSLDVGPEGATADSSRKSKQHAYNAWPETKALFIEWCDQRGLGSSHPSIAARWGGNNVEDGKRDDPSHGTKKRQLAAIHADAMRSLFLHTARQCAFAQGGRDVTVAREALTLVDERLGLADMVNESIKLEEEIKSGSSKVSMATAAKGRALNRLSKIISLALDTSEQSFAPKANVELWKRIKRMLPSSSEDFESGNLPRDGRSTSHGRDTRGKASGSNRLLLSRDDYLELEAEASAEAEDEDVYESEMTEQNPRSSFRTQRRSRHVEQELERWVRGASS
ncbi:uncharacterized protein MEPE_05284 [Melanopsichium pennsylvanicum]|uniref:Pentatricopeptide repeat protein n=2 Tax=Melanopsichium pennsylvanicum TaxID=63383 RepID=A0AAJ4XQC7_9BASI|nr:putative protein [Melanopsichium pennsylvanicum 4]SNX86575.1 uncharacterized protein MEPE_05284 [Melanopsichium pennsylvanicum]